MASSIVNYIIETYLSNIFEINSEETKTDLWNGTVELNNIKFKKSIFQTLDLPYLELITGYVGNLKANLSLPRFYLYPIKVEIDKIFVHSKQKNVSNLKKDEEINLIQNYKNAKLKNNEELKLKLNECSEEQPNMLEQIINNLEIKIKNIVIIFDDEISYKKHPFQMGIILENLYLKSTNEKFEIDSTIDDKNEIKFKIIKLENFSFFLDYYDKNEKIDFKKKLIEEEEKKIDNSIKTYLKEIYEFYAYCLCELNVYNKDVKLHNYILYNLKFELKAKINKNFEKNNLPNYSFDVNFDDIFTKFKIKQIKCLMKELQYIQLKNYYQKGLEDEIYNKTLNEEEIKEYIEIYVNYYKTKYIEIYKSDAENLKYKGNLEKFEKNLNYENIIDLRELADIKIKYLKELSVIDQKIEDTENSWNFFTKKTSLENLKKEREKLIKEENEKNEAKGSLISQLVNVKTQNEENKKDNMLYEIKMNLKKIEIEIIYKLKKLFSFYLNKLYNEILIKDFSTKFSLELNSIYLIQNLIENKFSKIIFSDEKNSDLNLLKINFEVDPKFKNSMFKLDIISNKEIFIVINYYYIYYLQYIFSKMFKQFDFNELSLYANTDITNYISSSYLKILSQNYNNFNINLNINLFSPIFIIPQNFFDIEDENNLYINFGTLKVFSELDDEIYDKYKIELNNMMIVLNDKLFMIEENNENYLMNNINFKVELSNIKNPKDEKNNNMILDILLNTIKVTLNEEHIIYLIEYLKVFENEKYMIEKLNNKLEKDNETKEIKKEDNNEKLSENKEIKNEETNKTISEEKKEETNDKNNIIKNIFVLNIKLNLFQFNVLKSISKEEEKYIINDNKIKKTKNFMNLVIKFVEVNYLISSDLNNKANINLGYIFLFDKDFYYNEKLEKNFYINKEFKCILGTTLNPESINENKVKLSDLLSTDIDNSKINKYSININYDFIVEKNEGNLDINIDKIFLSPNLNSLSRILLFVNFFNDVYNKKLNFIKAVIIEKKLKDIDYSEINNDLEKSTNIKSVFKSLKSQKIEFKNLTDKLNNINKNKIKEDNLDNKNMIGIKKEIVKSKFKVNLNLNSLDFIIQSDAKSENTYVLYIMTKINLKMNNFQTVENTLKYNYIINNNYIEILNNMNFELLNANFNLYSFRDNFLYINNNQNEVDLDNILKNFEIKLKYQQNLDNNEKLIINKILIESSELNFNLNFSHLKFFLDFYYNFNIEFPSDNNTENNKVYSSVSSSKKIILDNNKNIKSKYLEISNNLSLNNNNNNYCITNNIDKYSNFLELNYKPKTLSFQFFDYINFTYQKMLNVSLSELTFNYNSNSNPLNSENFEKSLIEMISGKNFSIEKFDNKNLYLYLLTNIKFEITYFNLFLNQWESFIEPINLKIFYIQVLEKMRPRIEIKSSNMLNFNISSNIIKILKIMKEKYEQKLIKKKEEDKIDIKKTNSFKTNIENKQILIIKNNLGVNVNFWFDNKDKNLNEYKFLLENNKEKIFTKKDIDDLNINYREMNNYFNTTFSFKVNEYEEKNYVNFNYNFVHIFKIKVKNNIYVDLCVKIGINKDLIRTIKFSSNFKIKNNSENEKLFIVNYKDERIKLEKNKNLKIPFDWFINENKVIYLINEENEAPDKKIFIKSKKKKNDKKEEYEDFELIKNENITFDYFKLGSLNNKNLFLYQIFINPSLILENKTPFEMGYSQYKINPLKTFNLYNLNINNEIIPIVLQTKHLSIKIKDEDYYLKIFTKDIIDKNKFNLEFENKINKKKYYIKLQIINNFNNNVENFYDKRVFEIFEKQIQSLKAILYFDYFIVNRTNNNIIFQEFIKTLNPNKNFFKIEVPQNDYILLSDYQFTSKKAIIKLNNSDFSDEFDINVVGTNFNLNLKNLIKNSNKLERYIPLGVLIKNSNEFSNSTFVIFENRYRVYNDTNIKLDFIDNGDKNNGYSIFPKEERYILTSSKKNNEFKLAYGVFYSQIFDIEKIGQFDTKLKIDENIIKNNSKEIFTYDNKEFYYPIRIIIHSIDNAEIFIFITYCDVPLYEIENKLNCEVNIECKGKTIQISNNKKIPLIFQEVKNIDKLIYHYDNTNLSRKKEINMNKFDNFFIKYKDKNKIEKKIKVKVKPSNKNQTKLIEISYDKKENKNNLKMNEKILSQYKKISGFKFYLYLIGIGLNLINNEPKEIFYLSFYGITFEYINFSTNNINNKFDINDTLILKVKNIQLDYCLDDSFPIILNPNYQILPYNEGKLLLENKNKLTNFLQILIIKKKNNIGINYPHIELILQEFSIRVDSIVINNLINLCVEYMKDFGIYLNTKNNNIEEEENNNENKKNCIENNLIIKNDYPLEEIKKEKYKINSLVIQLLSIAGMKTEVSFRIDKNLINSQYVPNFILNIFNNLSTTLISLSETPLKFSEILIENTFTDINSLTNLLLQKYKNEVLLQFYKILFGIDILGNPIKLLDNIGSGFYELFNEPRKNFTKGPKELGIGVITGVKSFTSNVIGGTAESLGKVTGSLLNATNIIAPTKTNTIETNMNISTNNKSVLKEKKEPKGFFGGVFSGIIKGLNTVTDGVAGIVNKPQEEFKKEGVFGFFKGVGTGVLGAVISPVQGVLTLGNEVSKGVSNEFRNSKNSKVIRFREPRILNENTPILPYNEINNKIIKEEFMGETINISINNKGLELENSTRIKYHKFIGKRNYIIITDILCNFYRGFNLSNKIYIDNIDEVKSSNGKCLIYLKNKDTMEINIGEENWANTITEKILIEVNKK